MAQSAMNRTSLRTVCIIAALACLAALPLLRGLQRQRHPLVMDITCRESGAVEDFYWKINQVFVERADITDALNIHFTHTVPNFAAYYIKTGPGNDWVKLAGDTFSFAPQEARAGFFIKAKNLFGEETAAAYYAVEIKNSTVSVTPSVISRTLRDIPFRFEPYTAPGMPFMREQTLPVAAAAAGSVAEISCPALLGQGSHSLRQSAEGFKLERRRHSAGSAKQSPGSLFVR